MEWEKLGHLYLAQNKSDWNRSHSALTSVIHLKDDIFRIFFSVRDDINRSYGSYVDIDIFTKEIILEAKTPILSPGLIGTFSDSGVSLSCYCKENGLFYYTGWSLRKNVPYSNSIGAAIFKDGILEPISIVPILPFCDREPFSYGYPWVMYHEHKYRMWYDTVVDWVENSTNKYICSLGYAESLDGINWEKQYIDCIPLKSNERCIARPCVIFIDNLFIMWYSIFDNNGIYSIGYAESTDGQNWERKDEEVGINKSQEGWDSESIEYPFIFMHKNEYYMLFNGNGYGKSGFGLAKLKIK